MYWRWLILILRLGMSGNSASVRVATALTGVCVKFDKPTMMIDKECKLDDNGEKITATSNQHASYVLQTLSFSVKLGQTVFLLITFSRRIS